MSATSAMHRRQIGHARGGVPVNAFFLDSPSGVRVALAEYGARVVSIEAPNRFGKVSRVFGLPGGLDTVDALEAAGPSGATHCALAGAQTDGPAHSVWWGEALADGVRFHYGSPRGEDGRRTEVECAVEYRLDARGHLAVHHSARCAPEGADAVIDLVTPLAFDLCDPGGAEPRRHEVQIESSEIAERNESGDVTGHLRRVAGTSLDRRQATTIFTRGNELTPPVDYALRAGRCGPDRVASLHDRRSGRRVEIETDRPVLRLEVVGCHDDHLPRIGLLPRNFPAADRHSHFPTVRLGSETSSTTIYRFGVEA